MFLLPVWTLIFEIVLADLLRADALWSITEFEPRIINGEEASPNQFPFHVGVKSEKGLCGGSLISEEYVLTAAHCTFGLVPVLYLVIINI